MKPGKSDMTLHVGVDIIGSVDADNPGAVSAVYRQLGSEPPSEGVVSANGDINLNRMDFDGKRFNRKTDITFTLSGSVTAPEGQLLEFRFPTDPEEAIVVKYNGQRTPDGMTPRAGADPMSVVLDDDNRDSRTYDYCLNVLVATGAPAAGKDVTCRLDPRIVNRAQ